MSMTREQVLDGLKSGKLTVAKASELLATMEKEAVEKAKAEKANGKLTLKVSAKKAISVYGLGQWPTTLYRRQWVRLLGIAAEIIKFGEDHASELSDSKDDDKADKAE